VARDVPLDVDVPGRLSGLSQIVGALQRQPGVGAPAERLVETDRHLGRDPGLSIDHPVQGLSRYAQHPRAIGDDQGKRLEAVVARRPPEDATQLPYHRASADCMKLDRIAEEFARHGVRVPPNCGPSPPVFT
jgi:hypothetical protein